MNSSDITVVIPSYNCLSFLKRTIASLESQLPDPGAFEVVIVDDGSSDGSGEYLRGYKGRLNLQAVIFEKNRGRSAARNAGIRQVTRPIVLLLDGDMVASPDLIAGHAASHTGEAIAVIGKVRFSRKSGNIGYIRYLESRGSMGSRVGERIPGRHFLSGHSSLPRQMLLDIGGFDETILHYGEDIDLGVRLEEAGASFVYAPELEVLHLHMRPFSEALKVVHEYGKLTLPYLTGKHPRLFNELRLNLITDISPKAILIRILLAEPFYSFIFGVTSILNRWRAPSLFYSYLLFRNYARGFQQAIRD